MVSLSQSDKVGLAAAASRPVAQQSERERPYLAIRNVRKAYGEFVALKSVSLDVNEGEFVCFLGPSGCGKTTLLRAIAGLDMPSGGSIEQGGRDVSFLPPSQRDFGIVFQSYALFPNLSAADNVAFGLKSRRLPKAEVAARVSRLLAMVGLPDAGPKYPSQMSGGQQQRVALARALATSPGLLLLDEPLSALDARVRLHLRHQIKHLQQELGVTTIMVTHDQDEALSMADRIVVMKDGVIEQVGAPIDIYRKPASRFVANFVGEMNFLGAATAGPGRVRVGQTIFACDQAPPNTGKAITACIRPEDVQVRSVGPDTQNALLTTVREVDFLGSFCRIELEAQEFDAPLVADFSINLMRDLAVAVGGQLRVALPADRLVCFEGGE